MREGNRASTTPWRRHLLAVAIAGGLAAQLLPAADALRSDRSGWVEPPMPWVLPAGVTAGATGAVLAHYPLPRALPARASMMVAVTSLADSGAGSLREALAQAVPGDRIDLRDVHGRIELQSALVTGADGVTILGPGPGALVLDAGGRDRVLVGHGSVTLSGLTLRGGVTPAGTPAYGGCQYQGGALTISNALFENCQAGSPSVGAAAGGAIFVQGKLVITGSTVRDNRVTSGGLSAGGGFFSHGLRMTDSVVSGNRVEQVDTTTSAAPAPALRLTASGGGFWVDDLTPGAPGAPPQEIGIFSSRISGNVATAEGGICNSIYSGQPAYFRGGGAYGAGFWSDAPLAMKYASIEDNLALTNGIAAGGGMLLRGRGAASGGSSLVSSSEVGGNRVSVSGSGPGSMPVPRSTAEGGGIAVVGGLVLRESAVAGNVADADGCTTGGGCYAAGGGLRVPNDVLNFFAGTISGNQARAITADGLGKASGGGMDLDTVATVQLGNGTVSGNRASGSYESRAGGLALGNAVIRNSTIAFNRSDGEVGGIAIHAASPEPDISITSSILARNTEAGDVPSDLVAGTAVALAVGGDHSLIEASVNVSFANLPLAADPELGPLAFNGGPTMTHVLPATSPAIDAGSNPDALPTDQRGRPRVVGVAADIGAFEFDGDRIFDDDFEPRLGGR